MKAHYSVKHYDAPPLPSNSNERAMLGWINAERNPAGDKRVELRFNYNSEVRSHKLEQIDIQRLRDFLTEILDDWS